MALPTASNTIPAHLSRINLHTRISTLGNTLLGAIQVQVAPNARISKHTPTLIKSDKAGMEHFSLHYKGKTIGEIDLSPDSRFVEWIVNLDSKNLEHVGKALMEFASKLCALKNTGNAKPDMALDASSGSSLFYFKLGFRFDEDENTKNEQLSRICSTQQVLTPQELLCNTPVGDMYLDLSKASRGPGDPRHLNALL
ncbi:MAG TPA: hypothetical protein DHW71_15880 [Gammaproteobacteria bacterium]|nr:hypothetical protein [Gammaproteobacteria bacterium]MEC8012345.1 GNAT family N-acetyltransferase [Pseudomonadota bacterium]HBF08146.1 hypothetical protein [Gammaproteobacteria bacterium]HCK94474.1 hypothetical protein [Gammaproteobacteria bacterium]|tara:strand:+ start:491 stop:1081 length:591 start_codon:yes stop_codon:yes gene_type:complete